MEVCNFHLSKLHTRLSFVFYEDETSLTVNSGFQVLEKCAQRKI